MLKQVNMSFAEELFGPATRWARERTAITRAPGPKHEPCASVRVSYSRSITAAQRTYWLRSKNA